jgi:hypothetical protein
LRTSSKRSIACARARYRLGAAALLAFLSPVADSLRRRLHRARTDVAATLKARARRRPVSVFSRSVSIAATPGGTSAPTSG